MAAWALLAVAAICGLLTVATRVSQPDMHVCSHCGDLPVPNRTIPCALFFRPAALQAVTTGSQKQSVFLQRGSVGSWQMYITSNMNVGEIWDLISSRETLGALDYVCVIEKSLSVRLL